MVKKFSVLVFLILASSALRAEMDADTLGLMVQVDTIPTDSLLLLPEFSAEEAWEYVDLMVRGDSYWKSEDDSLRFILQRLLNHASTPFDSTRRILEETDFSGIEVTQAKPELSGSVEIKWLNDSTFIIDPHNWSSDLYLSSTVQIIDRENLDTHAGADTIRSDSLLVSQLPADTLLKARIDTSAIESLGIRMYSYRNSLISPPLETPQNSAHFSKDSLRMLFYSRDSSWIAEEKAAFNTLRDPEQLDSLQYAISALLAYTRERDSTLIWLNDMYGQKTPLWLSGNAEEAQRFWVKNYNNDSITLWIGNPERDELSLLLEDDVSFSRLMKEEITHLPNFINEPPRELFDMKMLDPMPIYWEYNLSSVFTMNQTYLTNWTKGGESSFTTMIDALGQAIYNNKDAQTQWISTARLKFGTVWTQDDSFRKNNDLFEIASKINRNAWGKIGMSASFYMKNQLARGYEYPNDSTRVSLSKFLNPASLTIGLGAEYKPFNNTTINVAPLSYKNTFVLDTAEIDPSKHGIEKGKRSKAEMGMQVVVNNKITPFDGFTVINSLRLFSNYMDNPQNVDVDWELLLDKKINWFFTIRLNLHLIYDDDVEFAALDDNGSPIILPDGSEQKVAKTQFKEFIGLSLQFKI